MTDPLPHTSTQDMEHAIMEFRDATLDARSELFSTRDADTTTQKIIDAQEKFEKALADHDAEIERKAHAKLKNWVEHEARVTNVQNVEPLKNGLYIKVKDLLKQLGGNPS